MTSAPILALPARANGDRPAPIRLGPHSVEAEEAVLGSVLINAEVLPPLLEFLKPDDFFELKHAWIWEAMTALQTGGMEVDYLTLIESLRQRGRLDDTGGPAYISYLINTTPTHVNAETYARLVEQAATRRRIITFAANAAEMARSAELDAAAILRQVEAGLSSVADRSQRRAAQDMPTAVSAYYDRVIDLYQHPERRMGLPTGFESLDALLTGLHKSDLIIVAARPGVGKTSFLLNVAQHAAGTGAPTAIFTMEMGTDQVIQRLYAATTGIDSVRLRTGALRNGEWERFNEATGRLNKLPIYIDDTPMLTMLDVRNRARRMHREHGLGLIIIDYLQLMTAGGAKRAENRVQEVTQITRQLKELARELNVPVLVAAQLNRMVEQRGDKRPILSDLRESGSIEQDADIVMFLHRDDLYNPYSDRAGQADVIVAKHRNGPTGTIVLNFARSTTQFADRGRAQTSTIVLGDY